MNGRCEPASTAPVAQADADEDLSWSGSAGSTSVWAHQQVVGVREEAPVGEPGDHTVGRSAAD
ncbi:hypothetical protein [Streptomyces sp. AC512_CC834]|uniref:hypothetical protein n=1 Tax=Streptomyces sp. AC512_CC834 TaxID=2823691 RepID=UPI001C279629|nr:hypothetical protein [Streptomyces sp. AC512_CC834]